MTIFLNNIKKEYFTKVIFSNVRLKFPIEVGEKIGIIGKNGEGKTTFLKLIARIEGMEGGSIKIEPKRTKVFYMSVDKINSIFTDDLEIRKTWTTDDFLLSLNTYLYSLKNELDLLVHSLNDEVKLREYGELSDKFEKAGGFLWEEKVENVLNSLGLKNKYLDKLSGGEKSRLILASIQVAEADLILLDEPTNHLDILALQELEDFLKKDKRRYLIVSHDQKFLDNITTKILLIENAKIKLYPGNYSSYKRLRELEEIEELEKYKANQKEIKRLSSLASNIIERNVSGMTKVVSPQKSSAIKGKRFTNAQGRILKVAKDKDKMGAHYFNQKLESKMRDADIIRRRIDRFDKVEKPNRDWGIKFDLNDNDKSPDFLLRTKDLSTKLLIDPKEDTNKSNKTDIKFIEFNFPDIFVKKQEKVALIGPNGIGKSTFAKIIVGIIPDFSGQVIIPESISIGYYSQTHEDLKPDKNVLENLLGVDKIDDYDTPVIKDARNFLHQLLFVGDMALQHVHDLSQGERSKLSLAKIIYSNPNFLILDEPTNHLDIPSKERLEEALKKYNGAMLVISHDRYFMESIGINKYIELK